VHTGATTVDAVGVADGDGESGGEVATGAGGAARAIAVAAAEGEDGDPAGRLASPQATMSRPRRGSVNETTRARRGARRAAVMAGKRQTRQLVSSHQVRDPGRPDVLLPAGGR
jgi:hypothetical protein